MTITINFDLPMLLLFGVNLLGIFGYFGILRLRTHRLMRVRERIVGEVSTYFSKIGVTASAEVIELPAGGHFTIFADTEPLKRFRHSHIVEMMLIGQVKNATGYIVDKVYWRFPLPAREGAAIEAPENIAISPPRADEVDEYLEQGMALMSSLDGMEVNEDSWTNFQEAVHKREEVHDAAGEPEGGRVTSIPEGGKNGVKK